MSSGGLAVRWLHVLAMTLFKDAITGGRERDEEPPPCVILAYARGDHVQRLRCHVQRRSTTADALSSRKGRRARVRSHDCSFSQRAPITQSSAGCAAWDFEPAGGVPATIQASPSAA
jgi:hypothetical protein